MVISNTRVDYGNQRNDRCDQSQVQDSNLHGHECEPEDNEDEFVTYIRRRTMSFYLGGFRLTVTENVIRKYAKRRGVPISWISIRRYDRQNRAVIRLNLESDKGHSLFAEFFGPKGVPFRRW